MAGDRASTARSRNDSRTAQPIHGRVGRIALVTFAALLAAAFALRLAVRLFPSFGPTLADGLRAVIGAESVASLEEISAALEDRWKRSFHSREAPRSIQETLPAARPAPTTGPQQNESPPPLVERPRDVGPMESRVAAPGDGVWAEVPDPARPTDAPLLFATMLHPDPRRSWSEAFIVAMPTSRVGLHAVAGTIEPRATTAEGRAMRRKGLIPLEHQEHLLAAFNGGFKTEHGHHGMFVEGTTLVPAQNPLCTILALSEHTLRIGTWQRLSSELFASGGPKDVVFWRQGAPCMVERGALNPLLRDDETRNWGSTLDGNVVIRRSAAGLDGTRAVLYVGLSNDTTATAMAKAMRHAGATDVVQLDVNWSYPKFLLFAFGADGKRRPQTLFKGFLFREGEYVQRPSERDFFYLTRRNSPP